MAVERMPITPEVLTWARERAGYKLEELAAKPRFRKIADWESGGPGPTYLQLEEIAKTLRLPMAVFFFPKPPDLPPIEETFRTIGSEQFDEIPPNVRLLLQKARAFQLGLSELNDGRNPADTLIVRDLQLNLDDTIESAANRIRSELGVSLDAQFEWRGDIDIALKSWRSALFRVGVYVFKDAFSAEDYCGFSLYDDEFPVIYVNNSNPKSRQIFTLIHELAHLLFRTSGVDKRGEFEKKPQGEMARVERRCNAVAGAVLVPDAALADELPVGPQPRVDAQRLAAKFSVSREVIYCKFVDRKIITQAEYDAAAEAWTAQLGSKKRNGGNYYRAKIAYLGEEYISLVLRRFYQGRFEEEELADYLDTKLGNIDRLEEYFFGERR
ncbi:MAG: ImmA/IrrE family metallo-endopeptidase [Chloroflexi bacterium]|nr:ImmA/IrrE family metallo-endopeptidase [Chloroflexota bacterium]